MGDELKRLQEMMESDFFIGEKYDKILLETNIYKYKKLLLSKNLKEKKTCF